MALLMELASPTVNHTLNNQHQLQVAWLLYLEDYGGRLPLNREFGNPDNGWSNDNVKLDTTPTNIINGTLYPYAKHLGVYRCPSDNSLMPGTNSPRYRSYSMNDWLNGGWAPFLPLHAASRIDELNHPAPAGAFCFLDEMEESIDNPTLGVYPPGNWLWWNLPASRHKRGCVLSFCDGHVEYWKWLGSSLLKFTQYYLPVPVNDPDLVRVQGACPVL
jgi:prepilin-type processing-associated H-X9-DG protein